MSSYYRKSVYLCRAPWCKHKNIVWERIDADNNLLESAPAWKRQCGHCGRSSLDLTYQKVFKSDPSEPISPSARRDERRPQGSHPISQEKQDAQEH